ncbi:GH25 family lysozyme [Sphingomonas sp. KC8]|uniref:GH25 family lysozyme n=1 Tax=Sphingomonas sp. KC8 TaxID=1030157 RepID=UPI000248BB70|nr:GH25 family lysozyme [Sphingomonas sp. KC8]ARS25967.1 lysozyme [Sphingomonas sp. KC8]
MLKRVQHDGRRRRGLTATLALVLFSASAASPALRQGIDVSHHQGRIDWRKLPRQGVHFAYIKATEGGDHRDRLFAANWAGAKQAGVARGAYHYFTLCRTGAAQAANFIAVVPVDTAALPPAVDLEFLGNCPKRPTSDAFHAELATFLRLIEARYRQPVVLYLTAEFDRAYQVSARVNRPLWLRSLGTEPTFGGRPWHMWQVSHSRRLNGIATPVDWNVMR